MADAYPLAVDQPDFIIRSPLGPGIEAVELDGAKLARAWFGLADSLGDVLSRGAPFPGDRATMSTLVGLASEARQMAAVLESADFRTHAEDLALRSLADAITTIVEGMGTYVAGMGAANLTAAMERINVGIAASAEAVNRAGEWVDRLADD